MSKSKGNNNNKKVVKVEQEKTVENNNASSTTTTTDIPQDIQDKLNVINDKIKVIFEENKKKMLQVEHKFNQQLKSQFKKRSELLQKSKDFQGFWGTILSKAMIDNFADNDQAVVDCLTNIEVETDINLEKEEIIKKIVFSFKDNSIFKNKQITKEIITDKDGNSTCKNTKIDYTNSTPITLKNNTNNKKRKQVDFAEQSFILTWLQSNDADLDTFEEFSRLYEDPFSILLEEDHDDDDEDDDEFDGEDGEEDEEDDE
ncbi:NAP family protein [Dictyostelium discoideum AX4]|uniref:NAP family protein n=1 Tax=Dictyostelium discoideum TaxID=44689 RepID=Q55BE2_DICDI|nr:NAP family protein [Dictyostelium discoideum AX4]EAL71776.1 NAP family protein [Dictyostelium discoideum AX4]|eukprot:XP_645670.1 NAP family protein [Dictyostelium discoideum AX4]